MSAGCTPTLTSVPSSFHRSSLSGWRKWLWTVTRHTVCRRVCMASMAQNLCIVYCISAITAFMMHLKIGGVLTSGHLKNPPCIWFLKLSSNIIILFRQLFFKKIQHVLQIRARIVNLHMIYISYIKNHANKAVRFMGYR